MTKEELKIRNNKIKELYESGKTVKEIAQIFNLSWASVNVALNRTKTTRRVVNKKYHEGKKFGRLTVIKELPNITTGVKEQTQWLCKCDCGNEVSVRTNSLIQKLTVSCGCYHKEQASEQAKVLKFKHGHCTSNSPDKKTTEYRMWADSKRRAKEKNLPFNLKLSDIVIPEYCPILGIKLNRCNNRKKNDSPSIDKIIPELGYVKGNVCVISMRANRLKNDASLDEVLKIYNYIASRTKFNELKGRIA